MPPHKGNPTSANEEAPEPPTQDAGQAFRVHPHSDEFLEMFRENEELELPVCLRCFKDGAESIVSCDCPVFQMCERCADNRKPCEPVGFPQLFHSASLAYHN